MAAAAVIAGAEAPRCSKCFSEVPAANLSLHELRCPGSARPASTSTVPGGRAANADAAEAGRASSPPLAPTADEITQALTWARTRPMEVVDALQERLQQYRGQEYYPPNRGGRCVVTKEGVAVVREAIAYVMSLEPMNGVGDVSVRGLALAGEDHVVDIGNTGAASHASSDGTTSADRARRYGAFQYFGECLWYGSEYADARTMVLDLIVDDGVPSRGHRKGVYNPGYDVVGCFYGPHVTFGRMAAMEFARGWEENAMFVRSRLQSGPPRLSPEQLAKAKAAAGTAWSLGCCPICGDAIKGGKVSEVQQLGGKVHSDCFRCAECSKSLAGGTYRVHAKMPYCPECYHEKHGDKCAACSGVIKGGSVKCSLGVFHVECVVCSTCKTSIGKASFSTAGGAIHCSACAGSSGPSVRGGSRANSPARTRLSSTGNAILAGPKAMAPRPKAGAGAPKAAAGKAKPKARPKVSPGGARDVVVALGMDYASLE